MPPAGGNLPPPMPHRNRTLFSCGPSTTVRAHQPPPEARQHSPAHMPSWHGRHFGRSEVPPPHSPPRHTARERSSKPSSPFGRCLPAQHAAQVRHGVADRLREAAQGSSRLSYPGPHPAQRVHHRLGAPVPGQHLMEERCRWRGVDATLPAAGHGALGLLRPAERIARCEARSPCRAHQRPQLGGIVTVQDNVLAARALHALAQSGPLEPTAYIPVTGANRAALAGPRVNQRHQRSRRWAARVATAQAQRDGPVAGEHCASHHGRRVFGRRWQGEQAVLEG